VNLNGPYRTTRLALPGMIGRKWGRIVNLATTGARVGHAGHEAEEIGALAAFLCREEARGITAEDIQPSGGASW
jgi:NADP-dependent 3-hydroxy acid dehydrogenase YdfG